MDKNLKKIMTDLAAGHITQSQADRLLGKTKKVKPRRAKMPKNTKLNKKGGKNGTSSVE